MEKYQLANLQLESRNFGEAFRLYKDLHTATGDTMLLYLCCFSLLCMGEIYQARTYYEVISSGQATRIPALYIKGLFHIQAGEIDEALVIWNQILKSDPSNREASWFIDEIKKNKGPFKSKKQAELVRHYVPLPDLPLPERLPGINAAEKSGWVSRFKSDRLKENKDVGLPVDEKVEPTADDKQQRTAQADTAADEKSPGKAADDKAKTSEQHKPTIYHETPTELLTGLFGEETERQNTQKEESDSTLPPDEKPDTDAAAPNPSTKQKPAKPAAAEKSEHPARKVPDETSRKEKAARSVIRHHQVEKTSRTTPAPRPPSLEPTTRHSDFQVINEAALPDQSEPVAEAPKSHSRTFEHEKVNQAEDSKSGSVRDAYSAKKEEEKEPRKHIPGLFRKTYINRRHKEIEYDPEFAPNIPDAPPIPEQQDEKGRPVKKGDKGKRPWYSVAWAIDSRFLKASGAAFVVFMVVMYYYQDIRFFFTGQAALPPVPAYYHLTPPVDNKNILHEYFHVEQLEADFRMVPELIRAYQANKASFLLNKIIYSNADFKIRERARIYRKFIPPVKKFNQVKLYLSPQDISQFPVLHQGAVVQWSGLLLHIGSNYYLQLTDKQRAHLAGMTEDPEQLTGLDTVVLGEYSAMTAEGHFRLKPISLKKYSAKAE